MAVQFSLKSLWYLEQQQGDRTKKFGARFPLAQLNETLRPWQSPIMSPTVSYAWAPGSWGRIMPDAWVAEPWYVPLSPTTMRVVNELEC
ncbi:hypothetical protein INS49_004905 [Diaporthe citri]|uniref:uncharacterized protein n=1 Tax=Diaporthe citri TaxID=83186 RepID=UPI001C816BDA|nr:uncharacterized protein INS49_004905 [Diaporthe citri]KAG6354300.1 hypothetical protein INS49_004905 [Diaporthe citri]